MRKISLVAAMFLCVGIASASVIYDSTISPLPPNTPSEGYQCCQHSELGRAITFDGTDRNLGNVAVVMSNWAYASQWTNLIGNSPDYTPAGFYLPMTLNLYVDNGGTQGAFIGSDTVSGFIAWRPEPDAINCPAGPSNVNNQYQAGDGNCYNGSESIVNFDFNGLIVPDNLIYGLTFNTQSYGASPTGVNGPYNSLNFGLSLSAPFVGTDTTPGTVFNNGVAESGWAPYTPQIQFASEAPEPGTIGMMLGSLGALGVFIRRRKA